VRKLKIPGGVDRGVEKQPGRKDSGSFTFRSVSKEILRMGAHLAGSSQSTWPSSTAPREARAPASYILRKTRGGPQENRPRTVKKTCSTERKMSGWRTVPAEKNKSKPVFLSQVSKGSGKASTAAKDVRDGGRGNKSTINRVKKKEKGTLPAGPGSSKEKGQSPGKIRRAQEE